MVKWSLHLYLKQQDFFTSFLQPSDEDREQESIYVGIWTLTKDSPPQWKLC